MPAILALAAAVGAAATATAAFVTGAAITFAALATAAVGAATAAGISYLLARRPQVSAQSSVLQEVVSAVVPARYILGNVRTAGALVYAQPDGDDLHLVYVLSEGDIHYIDAVWAGNNQIGVSYVSTALQSARGIFEMRGTGSYANKFQCWVNRTPSNGSMTGLDVTIMKDAPGWTSDHLLQGKAWVYVRLSEPDAAGSGRVWDRKPDLTFTVRGMEIDGNYTANAAVIRKWYEEEIKGNRVDSASYNAARAVCSAARYEINGILSANDPQETVEFEMDQAWVGHVTYIGGVAHFYPGALRAETTTIIPDDVVEILKAEPVPSIQDRINSASMTLNQERFNLYMKFHIEPARAWDLIARDGVLRHSDFGTRAYITERDVAKRLIRTALRRARTSGEYSIRCFPRDDMSLLAIYPGDIVRARLPDQSIGLDNTVCRVLATVIRPDWSVVFTLTPEPSSIWLGSQSQSQPAAGVRVSTSAVRVTEASGSGRTARYTVVLTRAPTGTVTVTPSSGNTGVATVSGALTFTASNWSTAQTVTVTGVDNSLVGADLTTSITHSITGGGYGSVSVPSVTVTLTNDDVASQPAAGVRVSTSAVRVTEASGSGRTARYTVVLTRAPTGTVTVTPSSGNTGVATVSGALTFTASNWSTAQTVTVTGVDNSTVGADLTTSITHSITGGGYGSVSVPSVTVTLTNDDVASQPAAGVRVSTSAVRVTEASGSGRTARYTVVLTRVTDRNGYGHAIEWQHRRRYSVGSADLYGIELEHSADGNGDRGRQLSCRRRPHNLDHSFDYWRRLRLCFRAKRHGDADQRRCCRCARID